jgi:hypothetical protein
MFPPADLHMLCDATCSSPTDTCSRSQVLMTRLARDAQQLQWRTHDSGSSEEVTLRSIRGTEQW